MVKKRNSGLVFFLAALVSALTISGCNITNPIIDEWWPIEETYEQDYTFTHETYVVSFAAGEGSYVDLINKDIKGTNPPNQEILINTKAAVPGLVEKQGNYYFKGWYTEDDLVNPWNFDTPVTASDVDDADKKFLYLHAEWAAEGYTVEFDLNAPDDPDDNWKEEDLTYKPVAEKIANGAFAAEPLHFGLNTSEHYIFNGWYKDAECLDDWEFDTDKADEDADKYGGSDDDNSITLYAKWVKVDVPSPPIVVYTINFISGTAPVPSQYVEGGKPLIAPYVVYRDNYSFGGWYKDAECTVPWDFDTDDGDPADTADSTTDTSTYGDTAGDKIINLYAKWFPKDPVDIFKDLRVVSINYILFAGGGTGFNGPHGPGSSTNLTLAEQNTNDTVIKIVKDVLEANPHYRVMVVGHANPVTAEDKAHPQNTELMELSEDRAKSVAAELADKIELPPNPPDPSYDLTVTPIIPKWEGGRMALRDSTLSRRAEIIIFEIITETVTP